MFLWLLLPLVAQVQVRLLGRLPYQMSVEKSETKICKLIALNNQSLYDQAQHFFGPPAVGFGVGLVSVYRLKSPSHNSDVNVGAFLRFPLTKTILICRLETPAI